MATLPRLPSAIINQAADGATTLQATAAATGAVLPLIYGRQRVGGLLFAIGVLNGDLVLGAAWCIGPVNAIESVAINDEAVPAGVTVTHYLGSTTQSVNATLATAVAGYADRMVASVAGVDVPVCYSVFRVPPTAVSGFPRVTAVIQGRKLYDPRTGLTAYSTNPALALADWISSAAYGQGRSVLWSSVTTVANACDEVLSDGSKRRELSLALDQSLPVAQWADVLRTYAGCFIVNDGTSVRLIADRPVQINPTLNIAEARHVVAADAPAVTTVPPMGLVAIDARHYHLVDNVTLEGVWTLGVADTAHGHTAEPVVLAVAGVLEVADAQHAHAADNVTAQVSTITLTVAEARHGVSSDAVAVVIPPTLAVQDARHVQLADVVPMAATNPAAVLIPGVGIVDVSAAVLVPGGLVSPALITTSDVLGVADARHTHTADEATFIPPVFITWLQFSTNAATLTVAEAAHGQATDGVALVQHYQLTVADSAHGQSAESVTLDLSVTLAAAETAHGQAADNVTVSATGGEATLLVPDAGLVTASGAVLVPGGLVEP